MPISVFMLMAQCIAELALLADGLRSQLSRNRSRQRMNYQIDRRDYGKLEAQVEQLTEDVRVLKVTV
jgi:hypothetical protein